MTRLFASAVALTLLVAPWVRAQQPVDERAATAERQYELGLAHFEHQEWDQAVEAWEAGFRAKPAPQFLFNLAQAYRLSNRPGQALSLYREYLRQDPQASNRAEVERHIGALAKLVPQPKRSGPATRPEVIATAPPPSKQPFTKKGWFWGVVGGGVVVVAGAVILGLVLGSSADSARTLPPASFR